MNSIRASGGGLVLCAVVFVITILVFQIVLGPESAPETSSGTVTRSASLLENKASYLIFWTAEAITMGILAASAFVLAFRAPAVFALHSAGHSSA